MALSVSSQVAPVATQFVLQTSATATADNNVVNAPATVFMIDVDNTANLAEEVYVKLYNDAAPTVGTTAPDMVIMTRRGVRRGVAIPEGTLFDTALSFACVTTGGTVGTTNPSNAVVVRILAST